MAEKWGSPSPHFCHSFFILAFWSSWDSVAGNQLGVPPEVLRVKLAARYKGTVAGEVIDAARAQAQPQVHETANVQS